MKQLRDLIREVHRRSVWQVLAIYVAGSWLALQVVDVLMDNFGLPEWFPAFALGLLILGLPMVVATAFVQEGIGGRDDADRSRSGEVAGSDAAPAGEAAPPRVPERRRHRVFTWKNALIGGVAAFALWGVVAAAWMALGSDKVRADGDSARLASIAVLPLANANKDEDSQAFVTGIHDDLLTQLSKIDSLTVISRTSVMQYANTTKAIPQIGKELGVAAVLEGGVRRDGNRVRVNVQLIEAATDRHVWAETYDEELTAGNVFAIQSALVKRIAESLRATLTPETEARIQARPTESTEAYELLTRGRYILSSRGSTREGAEAAMELFKAAIAADSAYAPAYASLASAHHQLLSLGYVTESEALPEAKRLVAKALALDPNLAEAHARRGSLLYLEGQPEEAERAIRRALELNPGLVAARTSLSVVLLDLGLAEQALREARRAVELDPLSAGARRSLLSRLVFGRAYDEALQESRKLLEMKPDEADAPYYAGIAWSMKGAHARAIEAFRRAMQMNAEDPYYPAGLAWAYARAGSRQEALEALAHAQKLEVPVKEVAFVYAALGDHDRAFTLLDQAFEEEPSSVRSISVDPSSDVLKSDPRWNALLRKIGKK